MELNNKAQVVQIGAIMGVFIAVLVGVILMDATADEVGTATSQHQRNNVSFTAPANGTITTIATGIKEVSSVVIYNYTDTGDQEILDNNVDYVITNNAVVNGAEVARITVYNATFSSTSAARWNLTYLATPDVYISDGGARSVANLILIFFAVAILVIVITPVARTKMAEVMGR